MKTLLSILVISVFLFPQVGATSPIIDEVILEKEQVDNDDQVIIEEEKLQEIPDFGLKTFQSCEQVDEVMKTYLQTSYKNLMNSYGPYRRGFGGVDFAVQESVADGVVGDSGLQKASSAPVSQTNVQVVGVDESDSVKTNGEYIYYINESNRSLSIASIQDKKAQTLRNIALPTNYSGSKLYLTDDQLVLIATKYQNIYNQKDIISLDNNQKTVVIVFSLSDPSKPKIQKYSMIDGYLTRSRRIDNKLYILSQNSVSFHPWLYSEQVENGDISEWISRFSSASKLLPSVTSVDVDGGTSYKNTSTKTADCNSIQYVLPDESTQKHFRTLPDFINLTVLDLDNITSEPETNVVFGDVSEIYMDTENLYLTSRLYTSYGYQCRSAFCILPVLRGDTHTLIHKLSIKGGTKYQASNLVPGVPQSQYAMSSLGDDFSVVMQRYSPETATDVYILDESLKKKGSITGIAPNENFQSSRFIGNKLYLVTFERIDPLFVIDLSNREEPIIEGELKIPGYSTYLHPYDENHLIGVGFDTKENKWGGVQNAGVKVDLYDVSDVNNPKQLHTKTYGGVGSSSEVTNNPRAFVWYPEKNILFMPATLMERDDNYRNTSGWQGLVSMSITPENGISPLADVSHITIDDIDKKIEEECARFVKKEEEPICRKLRSGQEICSYPQISSYRSVPEYCFADSDGVSSYMGDKLWNYSSHFIKRPLYVGDTLIAISDNQITTHDISNNLVELSTANWK